MAKSNVSATSKRPERINIVFTKPSPDAKLNIGFKKLHDKLVVSSFKENPLITHLEVGDEIVSINGKDCSQMTRKESVDLLKSIKDTIYLKVKVPGGDPDKDVLTVDYRQLPNDDTMVVVSEPSTEEEDGEPRMFGWPDPTKLCTTLCA